MLSNCSTDGGVPSGSDAAVVACVGVEATVDAVGGVKVEVEGVWDVLPSGFSRCYQ